jgi:plastocyanin
MSRPAGSSRSRRARRAVRDEACTGPRDLYRERWSWGKVGAVVCVALGTLAIGGCGSSSSKPSAGKVAVEKAGKVAVEKAGKLEIDANPEGQLVYTTDKATATPGVVTITMANMSGVPHNIAIQQGSSGATQGPTPVLGASKSITTGSASVTVNLKPGTYTFFCQVPGHRVAGMWGTLTVK